MDARTQRTVYRLLALFMAAGAGDAIIQFIMSDTYDYRHLLGALVAAAVMAGEQYLKNSGDNAAPTVAAVNAAIQNQADVPPPKVAVPEAAVLTAATPAAPITFPPTPTGST
jgi:hypothetical protein